MTPDIADRMEKTLTSLDNAVCTIRVIATPDARQIDPEVRAALRLVADAMSHDLDRMDGMLSEARNGEEVAS